MNGIDGSTIMLGGFVATWIQIGIIYYKIGIMEQQIKDVYRIINGGLRK